MQIATDRLSDEASRALPWGTFVFANHVSDESSFLCQEAVPDLCGNSQDQIPATSGEAECLEAAFQESRLWGSPGHLPRAHSC